MTWGNQVSPTVLKVVMNEAVRKPMEGVCGLEVAHHGVRRKLRERGAMYHAKNGRTTGVDSEWVKDIFTEILDLFEWVGLNNN